MKVFRCPGSLVVIVQLSNHPQPTAAPERIFHRGSFFCPVAFVQREMEPSTTTDCISHPRCPLSPLSDQCHAATLDAGTVWQNSLAGWHKEVHARRTRGPTFPVSLPFERFSVSHPSARPPSPVNDYHLALW